MASVVNDIIKLLTGFSLENLSESCNKTKSVVTGGSPGWALHDTRVLTSGYIDGNTYKKYVSIEGEDDLLNIFAYSYFDNQTHIGVHKTVNTGTGQRYPPNNEGGFYVIANSQFIVITSHDINGYVIGDSNHGIVFAAEFSRLQANVWHTQLDEYPAFGVIAPSTLNGDNVYLTRTRDRNGLALTGQQAVFTLVANSIPSLDWDGQFYPSSTIIGDGNLNYSLLQELYIYHGQFYPLGCLNVAGIKSGPKNLLGTRDIVSNGNQKYFVLPSKISGTNNSIPFLFKL